jgi:hypothetical protein
MMTIKPEVGETSPVLDPKTGESHLDAGKHVLINSVGGALKDERGIVIEGPYRLVWAQARYKVRDKKGVPIKPSRSYYKRTETCPYWLVRLETNGFYLHFAEQELTFA